MAPSKVISPHGSALLFLLLSATRHATVKADIKARAIKTDIKARVVKADIKAWNIPTRPVEADIKARGN